MDTSTPAVTCKNCNQSTNGKYCHNCGQSTRTDRINSHYIAHELQHSLLHVDRGIFYTIKELLLRPGNTIRDYLAGKRISHFKPFAFVIILGTIYGFICHFLEVYPENSIYTTDAANEEVSNFTKLAYDWVYSHYSLVMLAFIPFYALGSYMVFRKSGYNYIEFVVVCSYIVGVQILILIATYFIYYFTLSLWVVIFSFVVSYIYHIWVYIQLLKKKSYIATVLKTLLSMAISFGLIMIAMFIIMLIVYICILVFQRGGL